MIDYIPKYSKKYIVKMKSVKYGFDCNFIMEVNPSDLLEKFGIHMSQIHGIEYQKESLMTTSK